jgi:beta-glucosidase
VAPPESNLPAQAGNYRIGFLSNYGFNWLAAIRYPFTNPGQIAPNGTLITGGGSGAIAPPYISAPLDAIQERAYKDDTQILYDTVQTNPVAHAESDACLVFINAYATEGVDRIGLHDDYSDSLVLNVASKCANTVVVIHNAGIRLVDQWVEHPNVTALIFAHLPGKLHSD